MPSLTLTKLPPNTTEAGSTAEHAPTPPQAVGRVESDVTVGSTLRALQAAALILLALVGFGTNTLVAIVFYRRPALRSPSNRFVLSLVLANLLTSLVVAPVLLVGTLHRELAALWWLRHASSGLITLAVTAAIFSVLAIAVDRYNAVLSPLHYAMTITRQRSRAMIAGAWGLAGLLATPPFLGTLTSPLPIIPIHPHTPNCTMPPVTGTDGEVFRLTYVLVLVTLGFTLPLFALCWIYARMYNAAHRNSERTRRHSISTNPGEVVVPASRQSSRGGSLDLPMPPCTPENFRRSACKHHHTPSLCSAMGISTGKRRCSNASFSALLYREEGRAVKTAAMVIASYLFCWTPFFAALLVDTWGTVGGVIGTAGSGGFVPEPFRSLAVLAALSSGCVTPFIYVFRNEAARSEAVKVLLWWRPGVWKYGSNVTRCNFDSYTGKPQTAVGSVVGTAIHHQDNFGMRRQSLSCGDSVSVQSFHIPTATVTSTAECRHCSSEGANSNGPPGTADFVATYEVVESPEESKKMTKAEVGEEPTGKKLSSSVSTTSNGKTRRESVTFRLAFLPQRRCQSCIRQNSDSSSGSGHPLIRSTDLEDCRTPPPSTSNTVSSRMKMTVSQKRQQFMIGRQGSSGEELTAGGPNSEPDTPQHLQATSRRSEQLFLREPEGAVILELEEHGAVQRSAAVYQFQETSLENEPRGPSVEEEEANVVVTRQDSDNSTTVRQDSNFSDVTVDSGVVADFAPIHSLVPFNRSQSSGSSISNYSLQQQQQQQPPQRPKRQRHKLQRLAAVEDEEDIVTAAPQSPTPPPRPPPPIIATTDAITATTPIRSTVKSRLKSSFKSRFHRPAFRIPKCDF